MREMWTLWQLVRADFLERTRRYSFLVTLGAMILVGYLAVPAVDSGVLTVNLNQLRGRYNSAWIGGMVALLSSMLLSIPGFYLVKNAIGRDRRTGVGQIVATTPLRKVPYLLSKALSNFVFLIVIIGLVTLAAGGMQLLRGEVMRLIVWDLVAPFVFVTLPVMAVVAAVAVFFECIPLLRGGFGNIAYFALYLVVLILSMSQSSFTSQGLIEEPANDLFGASLIGSSMLRSASDAYPGRELELGIGYVRVEGPIDTFVWEGIAWQRDVVAERAVWIGVAVLIVLASAPFFDRFDPARRRVAGAGHSGLRGLVRRILAFQPPQVRLLGALDARLGVFGRILLAELRLTFRGQPWWWYLAAAGLVIGGALTVDPDAVRGILLAAWLLPVLVWSKLGVRETRDHTDPILFSVPRPLTRHLPAIWLSGVAVSLLLGSGVALRIGLDGRWQQLGAWSVAAIFIPSLAFALGAWTGTSKFFEALYVVMWYGGPVSGLAELDFMGVTSEALSRGMPRFYLMVTGLLLAAGVVGRWRQIRR